MRSYAKGLPVDKDGNSLQTLPAPALALAQYANENGTASSVITVTQDTTALEIATQGTAAAMRWVATTDTQASVVAVAGGNFDHIIPPNSYRRFVIPIESNPATGYSSQMGANRLNGLYRRFAWKTQGIASVFASEF